MESNHSRDRVSCYGVCFCRREANSDGIRVLPVADFLRRLRSGEIIT